MRKKASITVVVLLIAMLLTIAVACVEKDSNGLIKLDTPQNLAVSGTTLSWDGVANAVKYYISVNDEEKAETTNTTFNLDANIISGYGNFNIKVRAYGDGTKYGTSDWSQVFVYNKGMALDTPAITVNVESKTASWAGVENCVSYTIKVYDGENNLLDTKEKVTDTSYTFADKKDSEGNDLYADYDSYRITVVAHPSEDKPEYKDSALAEAYYYNSKQLDVPVFSSMTTTLRWGSVENAKSYKIRAKYENCTAEGCQGECLECIQEFTTTGTSYQKSKFSFEKPGVYSFSVKAVGDNKVFYDSEWSQTNADYQVTKLDSISSDNITLSYDNLEDGAILKWTIDGKNEVVDEFALSLKAVLANGESELESSMTSKTISNKVTYVFGDKYKVFQANEDLSSATLIEDAYMLVYEFDGILKVQRDSVDYVVYTQDDKQVEYKDFAPSENVDILYDANQNKYILKNLTVKDSEGNPIKQATDEKDIEVLGSDSKQLYYFEMEENLDITKVVDYATGTHVFTLKLDSIFLDKDASDPTQVQLIKDNDYYGVLYDILLATSNSNETMYEKGNSVSTSGQYLSYKIPEKKDSTWLVTDRGEYVYMIINNYFNPSNKDTYSLVKNDTNRGDIDFGGYEIVTIPEFDGIINGNNMTVSNMVIANKVLTQAGVVENAGETLNYSMFGSINAGAELNNVYYMSMGVKTLDMKELDSQVKTINVALIAQNNYGSINRVVVQSDSVDMPCANVAGMVINNYNEIRFSQVFANLKGRNVAGVAHYNYASANNLASINEVGFYGSIEASIGEYLTEGVANIYGAGLVIENKADEGKIAMISKSESIGSVKVTGKGLSGVYAGGLVAINRAVVTSSYAGQFSYDNIFDQIVADGDNSYSGGFVAYNAQGASIDNSYATGKASASLYAGGFVGLNEGNITSSYATRNTTISGTYGVFAGKNSASGVIKDCAGYSLENYARFVGSNEGSISNTINGEQTTNGVVIKESGKISTIVDILYPQGSAMMGMANVADFANPNNPILNQKIYTKQYKYDVYPGATINVEGIILGSEQKITSDKVYGNSQKGNKVVIAIESGSVVKFVYAVVK